MGYINLTGDSDGDLHTAALHNAKFGAVASVLNGNIDRDNLSAPQSLLVWDIWSGFGVDNDTDGAINYNDNDVLRLSTSSNTTGVLDVANFGTLQTNNAYYLLTNSLKKAFADMTLVGVNAIVLQQPGAVTTNTFGLRFQKSSSLTGTYSDMATGTFNQNTANSVMTPTSISMSVTDSSLSANNFFRVLFQAPGSWPGNYDMDYPVIKINLTFKAYHIA